MSSSKIKKYQSLSSEETKTIAREFAARISKLQKRGAKVRKGALIVAMKGGLGAGKTTFVQGLARALGSRRTAPSPTFVIMRRSPLPRGRAFKNIFHIDAYRLKSAEQLEALEFDEIASDPANLILIEWAERVAKLLPRSAVKMEFRHGKTEHARTIIIKG